MNRTRFWIAQVIWLFAAIFSGIAAEANDDQLIPVALLLAFVMTGFTLKWGAKAKNTLSDHVMGYDGHVVVRVMATALIWITYLGGSVGSVMEMGGWGVLLALILMIPAITFTALLWTWERISGIADKQMQHQGQLAQKRKRERQGLDQMLDNLSDDDLMHLHHRLNDKAIDEEHYYEHMVGDDGELVYRN